METVSNIRISSTLDSKKKKTHGKQNAPSRYLSMLAGEIVSASSTQNDGENSNVPLTLGSQIAHLVNRCHTFFGRANEFFGVVLGSIEKGRIRANGDSGRAGFAV